MTKFFSILFFSVLFFAGCATPNIHMLRVESEPADALISIHETRDESAGGVIKVAGTTPVEKQIEFPESNRLRLHIEKRGYAPKVLDVTPETRKLTVRLERARDKEGREIREYAFPALRRIMVLKPDFQVIHRDLNKEEISESDTNSAAKSLAEAVRGVIGEKYDVSVLQASPDDEQLLKPVWRDVRTAMELIDPIRFKYLQEGPRLETRSSREAARQLGLRHGAEALLLLSGKQNIETKGMKLGKTGLTTVATMASYTSSYMRAVSRGDSYFVYTVYEPQFAEGTLVKAILIDCGSGDVLWINKGLWDAVPLDAPASAQAIIADLLGNL